MRLLRRNTSTMRGRSEAQCHCHFCPLSLRSRDWVQTMLATKRFSIITYPHRCSPCPTTNTTTFTACHWHFHRTLYSPAIIWFKLVFAEKYLQIYSFGVYVFVFFVVVVVVVVVKYKTSFAEEANSKYLMDWKIFFCPSKTSTIGLPAAGECDPYATSKWKTTLADTCYVLGLLWARGNFLVIPSCNGCQPYLDCLLISSSWLLNAVTNETSSVYVHDLERLLSFQPTPAIRSASACPPCSTRSYCKRTTPTSSWMPTSLSKWVSHLYTRPICASITLVRCVSEVRTRGRRRSLHLPHKKWGSTTTATRIVWM